MTQISGVAPTRVEVRITTPYGRGRWGGACESVPTPALPKLLTPCNKGCRGHSKIMSRKFVACLLGFPVLWSVSAEIWFGFV